MDGLKKFYRLFCKAEEIIVSLFIVAITLLVFSSAILRTINHPINWAQDLSLLLFAWVVFLSGDVALRRADFLRVDMLARKFPLKMQEFLYWLWYIIAIGFLGILVVYGIPLAIENAKRPFQTLGLSYSWATMSVPVGSALMIVTIIIKLVMRHKGQKSDEKTKEAI
ncbi:MAG: TRAP transporter small permease [Oscillospiraceae bacterium]|nr:TRAP transporter small permease [Oscillospiraceae bacterium]